MKLVSLEQKYSEMSHGISGSGDDYCPSFSIDAKLIDALGLKDAKAGTEMKMTANVCISYKTEDDDGNRSMTIEICEAGFEGKQADKNVASILFPND